MKAEYVPTAAVSWTFCYLGFSALLAFNCLLNCLDFFKHQAAYGIKIYTEAGLFYGLAMNAGLLALIFFGNRIPGILRVYIGCGSLVVSLVGAGVISMTRDEHAESAPRWDLILALALMGLGTSLVQGYFISLAAQFGGMAKFSSGQALAGLLCLPFSLVFKYLFDAILSSKSAFKQESVGRGVFQLFAAFLISLAVPLYFRHIAPLVEAQQEQQSSSTPQTQAAIPSDAGDIEAGKRRPLIEIVKDIFPMASMIWLNFFMLFLIFPGFVLNWTGGSVPFQMDATVASSVFFFAFNLGDLLGRMLVDYGVFLKPRMVQILTAVRLLITGVVLMVTFAKPAFLANHLTRIFVMLVYVGMQGLCVTWAFIHAPSKISNPAEHGVAGNLTSLFLANGILLGQVVCQESKILLRIADWAK